MGNDEIHVRIFSAQQIYDRNVSKHIVEDRKRPLLRYLTDLPTNSCIDSMKFYPNKRCRLYHFRNQAFNAAFVPIRMHKHKAKESAWIRQHNLTHLTVGLRVI
jgi:hypothetical protein